MAEQEFLTYKGRPMVRHGDTIYYGDTKEKYVVRFTILSTVKEGNNDVPDKVLVQLVLTDPKISEKDRVIKKSEKQGLYNAMDIGAIWLDRATKE